MYLYFEMLVYAAVLIAAFTVHLHFISLLFILERIQICDLIPLLLFMYICQDFSSELNGLTETSEKMRLLVLFTWMTQLKLRNICLLYTSRCV